MGVFLESCACMGIKADMVGRHTEAIGSEFRYVP